MKGTHSIEADSIQSASIATNFFFDDALILVDTESTVGSTSSADIAFIARTKK